MFSDSIEFENIHFRVDGFKNPKKANNILPILYEEQPATYLLLKNELNKFLVGEKQVLDVGTGSGFWGIVLKKSYPNIKLTALDKNKRSIQIAKENALKNKLKIKFLNTQYLFDLFPANTFDLIVLTPPYHLYPIKFENIIPLFARGGNMGQKEFKNQLLIADKHLKNKGKIIYNMMCLGDNENPAYCYYAQYFFDNPIIISYYNILPKVETKYFLKELYGMKYLNYQKEVREEFPYLYYTCGIIEYSKLFKIKKLSHNLEIKRTWMDRIELHREINKFK